MSIKQKVNYKTTPLMYIVQPEYQDVRVHMQTLVVKKAKQIEKEKVVEVSQVKVEEEIKKKQIHSENSQVTEKESSQEPPQAMQQEVEQAANEEKVEEALEKQKPQRKTRKSISQMSIQEKVEFFTTVPKSMPRTLCQIETNNETYRGVIMTEVDGIVTIRTLTNTQPIDLPLDEIKAINLLGF
ncbi:CotO family spore coat protein [Metabacillus herbersteinensis]|uniref:CotO family spore coat protein n=1 Tax=Metabacillus herbersteinensis TaxID=283816 RepID=A0ABV6GEI2_9BACI